MMIDKQLSLFVILSLLAATTIHGGRRRMTSFTPCSTRRLIVKLEIRGCLRHKVITYGCNGYCSSETMSLLHTRGFAPTCNCCLPETSKTFTVALFCPKRSKRRIIHLPILAATSCSCRHCGAHTDGAGRLK
uniref:Glycoprotein hormone-like secreted protein n=1 Tax=Tripedalia cystophora TaxID=6141 RepID=A0A481ZMU0_TRICY|nr:glycoprotein hormone-like secreted protein [Tripedalia cystophora]